MLPGAVEPNRLPVWFCVGPELEAPPKEKEGFVSVFAEKENERGKAALDALCPPGVAPNMVGDRLD